MLIQVGYNHRRICWDGEIVQKNVSRNLIGSILILICVASISSRATSSTTAIATQKSRTVINHECVEAGDGQLLARTELYLERASRMAQS
jgi:hypothetical protein